MPFNLSIEEGIAESPERIVVYGMPGVGKSTLAAGAPRPLFIDLEEGSKQLNVARVKPTIESWSDLLEALTMIANGNNSNMPYSSLVIDTLDRAEWLCWRHCCQNSKEKGVIRPVDTIEEVNGGYGKGYVAAYEEWRRFFGHVEAVVRRRGMRVIMLAHAKLDTVPNPSGADYQRYTMKLHKQATGMFFEAADAVLFASYNIVVKKGTYNEERSRAKAVTDGARYLYATDSGSHIAKNRFNLPEAIPLSWDDLAKGIAQGHSPDLLIETMRSRTTDAAKAFAGTPLAQQAAKLVDAVEGGINRANRNTDKLIILSGWIDQQMQKIEQRRIELEASSASEA